MNRRGQAGSTFKEQERRRGIKTSIIMIFHHTYYIPVGTSMAFDIDIYTSRALAGPENLLKSRNYNSTTWTSKINRKKYIHYLFANCY